MKMKKKAYCVKAIKNHYHFQITYPILTVPFSNKNVGGLNMLFIFIGGWDIGKILSMFILLSHANNKSVNFFHKRVRIFSSTPDLLFPLNYCFELLYVCYCITFSSGCKQ